MPYGIRVCTGLEEGELYPLFENREITLGRSPTNNVFVRDRNVSRVHCQIVATEDNVILTDLQSTNGTFVNGERESEVELRPGDEIRLGTTLLRLEEVSDEGGAITDTALMK
jgi:pSer/pThr/pTyr-binding forkhead associated (FHA) protein